MAIGLYGAFKALMKTTRSLVVARLTQAVVACGVKV